MVELVDTLDLGSSAARCESSSLSEGTIGLKKFSPLLFKINNYMKNQINTFSEFINEAKLEAKAEEKPKVNSTDALDQKFKEFSEARLMGATKIANSAKESGGHAMLTYHHFVVKLPYYKKAVKGWTKADRDSAVKEYNQLVEELYLTRSSVKIDQTAFQKLVGKIEVFGELVIKYDEIY